MGEFDLGLRKDTENELALALSYLNKTGYKSIKIFFKN
jgi:hypothetical protein